MAKIKVKHFAGFKNEAFLDMYNNEKTAFIREIPDDLKTAIKTVSDYVWKLKQGITPDVNLNTFFLLGYVQTYVNCLYESEFLDFPPSELDAISPIDSYQAAVNPVDQLEVKRSYQILHWLQRKLQRLWLITLDEMAAKEIDKIISHQRTSQGMIPLDTVLIFTLPEFYFTYLPDFGHSAETRVGHIQNYSKPFYSENLDILLHGKDVSGGTQRNWSLKKLGNTPNVVILAGTVRWKEIQNDHTTEFIYNTLPIFSNTNGGTFLWSKIRTSSFDGHGYRGSNRKKVPKEGRGAVTPRISNGRGGVLAAHHMDLPQFSYTIMGGHSIQIGIDICMDYGMLKNFSLFTHIHVLIAAGMFTSPIEGDYFEAGAGAQAFFRNDSGGNGVPAGINTFIQNQHGSWQQDSLTYKGAKLCTPENPQDQVLSGWFKKFKTFEIEI